MSNDRYVRDMAEQILNLNRLSHELTGTVAERERPRIETQLAGIERCPRCNSSTELGAIIAPPPIGGRRDGDRCHRSALRDYRVESGSIRVATRWISGRSTEFPSGSGTGRSKLITIRKKSLTDKLLSVNFVVCIRVLTCRPPLTERGEACPAIFLLFTMYNSTN